VKKGALLLALGAAAVAGAQEARPRTRVMTCTTSGCHASELEHEFLHGPTAVSACDACHTYVDPAEHSFRLRRQGADLCTFCHIGHAGTEGPFVHAPMAEGRCTECHNPHGGSTRELLQAPSVNAVCLQCHTEILAGQHAHKPAEELCTSCHLPHTSDFEKLLRAPSNALCANCHGGVFDSVATMSHPHPPAQGDCLTCHTPHASDAIKILRQPPQELCVSCHADVGSAINVATHPHSVVTDERSCLNCHSPHASEHTAALLEGTIATCLECHDRPIQVSQQRTIIGVPELADPSMHLHGPAQHGDCSACHDVHGGVNNNLLVEPFPEGFYQPFTEGTYALCLKCHDSAIIEAEGAEVVTGFRNGERNLHAVHVVGQPQGRSCRACHAMHASKVEPLIAETVSFGQWQLPINWTPTPTGGSCASGCHEVRAYDRVNPISKDAPVPDAAAEPDASEIGADS